MRKDTRSLVLPAAIGLAVFGCVLRSDAAPPAGDPPVREIFVPLADLEALLESQPQRVLLSRREYERLLQKAKTTPETHAPRAALLVSADYSVAVLEGRAQWTGKLAVDVLEPGLHAVPLDLSGIGLQSVILDGRPAAVAPWGLSQFSRSENGTVPFQPSQSPLVLFVEGVGRHELVLQMVSPLETTAAQQVLRFHIPRPSASRLRLSVPGDVEVKSGASVVSREMDETAEETRFELLPPVGDATLVMTLNSRLKRHNRVVTARSVLVDEVTQAYERLHATVSLGVLHGAVDGFRFAVPDGFDVTDVNSPLVARWAMETDAASSKQVLDVRLREPSTETVVLNVSAIKTPPQLDAWSLPKLEPLDVVSQVAVLGVLAEDRLRAESIASEMLIPIDTADLLRALPETVFQAEQGAATLKPVAAYYAPGGDFRLAARFDRPPAATSVVTNVLLVVAERSLEARGQFLLTPEVEKLFGFDFSVPGGWHVTSVTAADEKPLDFEEYADAEGHARIRVRIAEGVSPGGSYPVSFTADSTPDGWLDEWQSRPLTFPVFTVSGTAGDVGAIAVEARDDLMVRPGEPDTFKLLTPLDDAEKQQYGLTGVEASLVYRYDSAGYSAGLVAERTEPRLTARTFSFFRISPEGLTAHYEIAYQVEQARTAKLSFVLPDATPETLSIRGLDGVGLKEYSSEPAGEPDAGLRRWHVLLAGPRRGQIRLAVDFQQPLPSQEPKDFALPLVTADGVAYQSGFLAVEGNPELDVQVDAKLRAVDVGELVDAEYQPGRGLLGVFGFVGDPPQATVDVFRHPGYPLDPAIVQRADLATQLSAEGVCQTAARFELRAKVPYLTVNLPHGSKLWSADLDGQPIKPQSKGESLLVSVPAAGAGAVRTLRIVYEDASVAVSLAGKVDVCAPKLYLPGDEEGSLVEVPVADMVWRLYLPSGYEATASDGTLVAQLARPEPALVNVARTVVGLVFFSPALQVGSAAGDESCTNNLRQLGLALHDYQDAGAAPEQTLPSPYYMSDDVQYAAPGKEMPPPTEQPAVQVTVEVNGVPDADAISQREPVAAAPAVPPAQPAVSMPAQPQSAPTPQRKPAAARRLEGFNSLKIELADARQADQGVVVFQSLGVDPQLQVSLANGPRFNALGWALALAVLLVGLAMSSRPGSIRARLRLILGVTVLGTLVPLIPGLEETATAANMAVYAAALLVPYYLLLGCVRWFVALFRSKPTVSAPAAAAVLIALAAMLSGAVAAEPPARTGPYVIQVVEPDAPVTVPEDALILPYDPDSPEGTAAADRILVPYAKYVELWNRAYPDEKLTATPPPAPYALAGASYRTTLEGDEYLLVEGHLDVDVFTDDQVTVPLGLAGGVLAKAELDGKPARLSIPEVDTAENQPQQQAAQAQRPQPPTFKPQLILLHVTGKGRHVLSLSARLRLERRGGWRVADGVLPSAPAAAVEITVLKPETELRLGNVLDRRSFETDKADQKIETVLGPGGAIGIQWRPKVAEAQVDRSLTSQSSAVLDVQEDGFRVVWELSLEFPRTQRDAFDVYVPEGYLVKRVEGTNVRGWEVRPSEGRQTVSISLLNTARDQERFTLHLWQGVQFEQASHAAPDTVPDTRSVRDSVEFEAPVVTVADAALAGGQLTIRRSPLLDLRSVSTSGATRTDLPSQSSASTGDSEESPLGLRPFQAYAFVATPFSIRLAASPVAAEVSANVQSVLKIAEYERSMESRINLDVRGRPIYRVEVLLPENLELPLESVSAPGEHQWAVTERDGRQLLSVYLATGQQGQVPVVVRGKLTRQAATEPLGLPRLDVLDVVRQEGDIAVQVDPALDVRTADLANCQTVLLDRVFAWLDAGQKQATRLALHTSGSDYRGNLLLSLRQPRVTCDTITNVRVTDRAVQETILLDFTIAGAGIRELSFLLPASMKDCRVSVPMLRQKTDEPAGAEADSPRRIRIELQDDVIDSLRVLVEHDRPLSAEPPPAPIPVLETEGRPGKWNVGRQFVALQNAGRDELVVREMEGLTALNRQQKEWQSLRGMLGGNITQAYLARDAAAKPSLRYALDERKAVELTGARIRFAETDLVVDRSGAYRGRQIYRLDNTTEQFLEIKLPDTARLWTAQVAGAPVKPTIVPGATEPGLVRIPLVKTAEGDLDFAVVLNYGGKMPPVGKIAKVGFPLIAARGINVELSQVRLHLPQTHSWFDFGGTMTPVSEEGDLAAGYLSYQTKVAERLMKTAEHAGEFAQVRAASNLKNLKQSLETGTYGYRSMDGEHYYNESYQQEYDRNAVVLRDAEQQIDQWEQAGQKSAEVDNRDRLNDLYSEQRVNRARNVVQGLGYNFGEPVVESKPAEGQKSGGFNAEWLDKSKLSNAQGAASVDEAQKRLVAPGGKPAKAPAQKGEAAMQGQFQAPVFKQDELGVKDADLFDSRSRMGERGGESNRRDTVTRYQEQLRGQQQAVQMGDVGLGGAPRDAVDRRVGGGVAVGEMPSEGEETLQVFGRSVNGPSPADVTAGVQATGVYPVDLDIPFLTESLGLASLDVELPQRGVVYRFKTPGGDVGITARAASNRLIGSLLLAAGVLAALALALLVIRMAARGRFAWVTGRVASVLFVCLGLALLVFLPMLGLLLLVTGIMTAVRRAVIRRAATTPFAEPRPAEVN